MDTSLQNVLTTPARASSARATRCLWWSEFGQRCFCLTRDSLAPSVDKRAAQLASKNYAPLCTTVQASETAGRQPLLIWKLLITEQISLPSARGSRWTQPEVSLHHPVAHRSTWGQKGWLPRWSSAMQKDSGRRPRVRVIDAWLQGDSHASQAKPRIVLGGIQNIRF